MLAAEMKTKSEFEDGCGSRTHDMINKWLKHDYRSQCQDDSKWNA